MALATATAAGVGAGPSALLPVGAAQSSASSSTRAPGAAGPSYDQLAPAADDGSLQVVSLLPTGLLASPGQASEIRVQFDRPVVELSAVDGRPAGARFMTIDPPVAGTFRWASTRLLIFTPDAPLGWGRRYAVTVQGASSIDNRTLKAPVRASFETPVPMCERTGSRVDSSAVAIIGLRCSRVLDTATIVDRLRLDVVTNGVSLGTYTPAGTPPADLSRILTRLRTAAAAPKQTLTVTAVPTGPADLCTPSEDGSENCVFVRSPGLPPEKSVRVAVLAGTRTAGGNVAGRSYALGGFDTAATPLIAYPGCTKGCDPDMVPGWSVSGAGFSELALSGKLSVTDLTANRTATYRLPAAVVASGDSDDIDAAMLDPLSLRWANLRPRTAYRVRVAADAVDRSGQRLGYTFTTDLSRGKRAAGLDGTRGERVLEGAAPSLVGYTVRNLETYQRVLVKLDADAITRLAPRIAGGPGIEPLDPTTEGTAVTVRLGDRPDVDRLTAARLGDDGTPGVYLLAVKEGRRQPGTTYDREGRPIAAPSDASTTSARPTTTAADDDADETDEDDDRPRWFTSLVQYTDLGVTIRRSPGNALLAVTSIGTAAPVAGAKVEVRTGGAERSRTLWTGTTDAEGLAVVDGSAFEGCARCDLIAIATKDKELAYAQSRWREWGIDSPSESFDATPAEGTDTTAVADLPPVLPAGQSYIAAMFADRGVYRLGDEVKVKGIIRVDSGRGLELPDKVRRVRVEITDNTDSAIATSTVEVSKLGSFDLSATIPAGGRQGSYYARVVGISGGTSWLVTAFRNPDFKVDTTLDKRAYVMGDRVAASFEGGYLFGAPMGDAPVTWTISPAFASVFPGSGADAPTNLGLDAYRYDYICVDYANCDETPSDRFAGDDTMRLDERGRLEVGADLPVIAARHRAVEVVAEAEVTDVNRQTIANRSSAIVHPGEHYVGVRLGQSFVARGRPIAGTAVAVTATGRPVAGVEMTARLVRWEYVQAKRQTGDSSTSTDGRWVPTEVATQTLRSTAGAVPFSLTPARTGYYEVRITSRDRRGNWVEASTDAYVTGPGYVSWETPLGSKGSITMIPERTSYKVGDTARILVQSPWEKAEALVTTEGSLVFGGRRVAVRGSSAVIEVPITDEHVPNVLVSVTLYRGRTAAPGSDVDDPGRPMIRTATVSIDVPSTDRRLDVSVSVPRAEEKPGAATSVSVQVRDASGNPAAGEATIWAVDEGVLRLTNYTTPDLVAALVQTRYDQTFLSDSRMLLISPVSLARAKLASEKGDEEQAFAESPGGGGDAEAAASASGDGDSPVRRDFRTLAAWSAVVPVGADGKGTAQVKLPEQLTEFRVIAVAASGAQRFGGGVTSVRTSTPFSVNPAMPRFVTLGDTVEGGVVVQNRTGAPAKVTVSAQMNGASTPLTVLGQSTISRDVPVGATEIRFRFSGRSLGSQKMTFRGTLTPSGAGAPTPVQDAVEVSVPVSMPLRQEVVAASGEVTARPGAGATATERLTVPGAVQPGVGGLEITTSASALAGLQAGIQNLVEYPYGCLEQRTSRLKVLMGLRALGRQWTLPGLPMQRMESIIATELAGIRNFQTGDGGLAYWPDDGRADVYLSSRTLILLLDAKEQGLTIPVGLVDELTRFLQGELERFGDTGSDIDRSSDSLWWNQAEVVYALARAGAPEPAFVRALFARRFDLTQREQLALLRAMLEAGMTGNEPKVLYSQIRNGLRLEGNRAALDGERYGEMPCWCISYLLADDTHLTAELLSIVVRADPSDPLAAALARELVARRVNGTWRNTLEDGYALTALVDYGRLAENVAPELSLTVTAGAGVLAQQRWSGASLESKSSSTAIGKLPAGTVPLSFTAIGSGRVSYTARLTYARPLASLRALDQGFTVLRSYEPFRRDVSPGAARSTAADRTRPPGAPSVRERASATGGGGGAVTFQPGDIVRVTVAVSTAQVRSNVVIEDPLPAGFEAIDSQLASTTQDLVDSAGVGESSDSGRWYSGIDRVEIRDDRVLLFATRLEPGELRYSYLARATAPGSFTAAPTQAAEMYRPELFGRTATSTVLVR